MPLLKRDRLFGLLLRSHEMAFQESKCLAETLNRLPYIITHHSLPLCWLRFLLHVLDLSVLTHMHARTHTHAHTLTCALALSHSRSHSHARVRRAPSDILMPAPFVCFFTLSHTNTRTHTHSLSHTHTHSHTITHTHSLSRRLMSFFFNWKPCFIRRSERKPKLWKQMSRLKRMKKEKAATEAAKKSHQQLRLYLPQEQQRLQRRRRRWWQRQQQPEKEEKLTINLMDEISGSEMSLSLQLFRKRTSSNSKGLLIKPF